MYTISCGSATGIPLGVVSFRQISVFHESLLSNVGQTREWEVSYTNLAYLIVSRHALPGQAEKGIP